MLIGGTRDRAVLDSVSNAIEGHLGSLGWFDATVYDVPVGFRQHLPLKVVDEFPDDDTEVALNTLAFSWFESEGEPAELGTNAEIHAMSIYVDFFAQSDGLGRHVTGDVYAFVKSNPVLPVFDYDQVTPVWEFNVRVDERTVDKRKPPRATNPWQKHWYVVSFVVEDDRANA